MTLGHHTNDNERGRCLMDVFAEAEGVPVDVWQARFFTQKWIADDFPPNMICYGLGQMFDKTLPNITTQCRRNDDVDQMIRVACRHHQRAGAA